MANENGGTGDRRKSPFSRLLEKFSWMPSPSSIWGKLTSTLSIHSNKPSPPPLLPVAIPSSAAPANPITETLQEYELGKVVLTLAFPATTGLLYSAANGSSEKLDAAHHFILVGLMAACTALVNGLLLKKPFPRHANLLQLLGSGLGLLFLFGLVGSFLPKGFSWACWLCGVLCQTPFIYAGIAIWKA